MEFEMGSHFWDADEGVLRDQSGLKGNNGVQGWIPAWEQGKGVPCERVWGVDLTMGAKQTRSPYPG